MLEREYKFYQENRTELIAKYKKPVLVIVGESVVGEFDTHAGALSWASKKFAAGTFLIQDTKQPDVSQRFYSRVRIVNG